MKPSHSKPAAPTAAVLVAGTFLLICAGCSPDPFTESLATSMIEESALGPVQTTFLNPMQIPGCNDLTRFLVYCEEAGLVKLEWTHRDPPCGEFEVALTERGAEYFTDLRFAGSRDVLYTTKGWQVTLREPVHVRLVELEGIEHVNARRKLVRYSWQYEFPPELAGCTRHTQPGVRRAEAGFTWSRQGWKLD